MNKINFTEEQVRQLIKLAVDRESDTSYHHGSYESFVVPFEGKHYSFTLTYSHNEGLVVYGETEAIEVEAVQVTRTEWHTVK